MHLIESRSRRVQSLQDFLIPNFIYFRIMVSNILNFWLAFTA